MVGFATRGVLLAIAMRGGTSARVCPVMCGFPAAGIADLLFELCLELVGETH